MQLLLIALLVAAASARFVIPQQAQPVFNPPASIFKPVQRDCAYQEWGSWSQCNAQCDQNDFQQRTRTILKEASGYGQKCDQASLEEWRQCQGPPCPRDCVMGSWNEWSTCSANCDQGERRRWRQIQSQPTFGGAQCGNTEESEACNNGPCAVHCQMSSWSLWSDCSAPCEEGRRQRLRSVNIQPQNGGRQCGPLEEWEECNNGPCAQDCALDQWQSWSQCPSCGQASRTRSRGILQQGAFGGVQCDFGSLAETESCNNNPCPIDCQMTFWAAWSRCSADCGTGRRARTRSIQTPAAFGGRACGNQEEWEECNDRPCAVHCEMSAWSGWSDCSAPCDEGRQQRLRNVLTQPQNGGRQCENLEEWQACNNGPCAVDCQMSQWSQWSDCSANCDAGRRQRLRSVLVAAQNGGLACAPAEEWGVCNNGPCPQDCAVSEWGSWSQCPACGQASRSRARSIIQQAAFGGQQCDFAGLAETENCNNRPCAIDCVQTQWSQYSQCSAQCGEGRRQRIRNTITDAAFGGLACGPAEEWETCNDRPCEVDCVMSEWSAWSQCSSDCGAGRRQRLRNIAVQPANGGRQCPSSEEWEACDSGPCPQDCALDQWQSWSQCPSCGQASRSRSRGILQQGAFGGQQCDFGSLTESEQCPFISCAVDCQVSSWSAWSACSEDCGAGSQQRLRSIITRPANGGELCPELEEWRKCNNGPCQSSPPAYSAPFANPAPAPVRYSAPAPTFAAPAPAPAPVVRFANPGPVRSYSAPAPVFSAPAQPSPPQQAPPAKGFFSFLGY